MPTADRPRVLIAGGGFAAVEALLALRALAGDRVDVRLIAPNDEFSYRPSATAEPFGDGAQLRYDLAAMAADLGAEITRDSVAAVAPAVGRVRLASHARLDYDFLILAIGARIEAAIPGATTFRDQRDTPLIRRALVELWAGESRRIAFAVPSGTSWSLPMYELALLAATEAADHRLDAELLIVSAEERPLEAFGTSASLLVAELLREHEIRFIGGAAALRFDREGALELRSGMAVHADRVIAAPRLVGPRIPGIPGSWSGFTPVDACGRVDGLERVYAAGDMTTYLVKQGGLAAQQADDIAHHIAAAVGAPVKELHADRELKARLIGGPRPVVLRAVLDANGQPGEASWMLGPAKGEPSPETKVSARYLTPYLERRSDLALA